MTYSNKLVKLRLTVTAVLLLAAAAARQAVANLLGLCSGQQREIGSSNCRGRPAAAAKQRPCVTPEHLRHITYNTAVRYDMAGSYISLCRFAVRRVPPVSVISGTNNNNNNNNPRTIFIVLSSSPLKVIARVHSVHLMNAAQRTSGCRPSDQAT